MDRRPKLHVDLSGEQGRILILLGLARKVWKSVGHSEHHIRGITSWVKSAEDYNEALYRLNQHVNINDGEIDETETTWIRKPIKVKGV